MEEKQSRDSSFVSLPGVLSLLFLTVVAIYFNAWMISAFLFFMTLLCFCSRIWSRGVLKRVEFQIEAVRGSCHVGETLQLKMKVRNHSFFPLVWMDVILPMGKRPLVRLQEEEDFSWYYIDKVKESYTGIRARFVWLLWQQEIQWEETLKGVKRGVIEVAEVVLQAGDGFGLAARESFKALKVPLRLIIYPQIHPVNTQPFLKITQETVARNRGQSEDITVLKNIRPYQPGDPMKRINWRHLAGSGRMEVNVYETVMPGCAAFLLDLGSFRTVVTRTGGAGGDYQEIVLLEDELEEMISLAASCMRAVEEQGIATALIIPAYGEKEACFCIPGQGDSALEQCMEELALLDYRAEEPEFPYEEFWHINHKLGTLFLCTRTEESSTMGELAQLLGRGRVRYLAWKRGTAVSGEYECLYAEEVLQR